MLQILPNQSVLTMSSREIADLVDTTHDSVLKTIRELKSRGVVSPNETTYMHPQNKQSYPEFFLSKRDTLLIASGYSVELRARIIDRLEELENRKQFQIPQTFAEALRLAADQQEIIQQQAAKIEQQRPSVEFVDKYVESTGNMGFRQVAKLLGIKENDFRAFLQDNHIMYKLGKEWVAYAPHINAGRFVTKTGTANNGHAYNGALFTPKGVQWVAGLIESV